MKLSEMLPQTVEEGVEAVKQVASKLAEVGYEPTWEEALSVYVNVLRLVSQRLQITEVEALIEQKPHLVVPASEILG